MRVARELGLAPVMWNVTGYDWNAPPAEAIERKVAKQIRGGDVILLHDGGHKQMGADRSQTVIATDRLITHYKDVYKRQGIVRTTFIIGPDGKIQHIFPKVKPEGHAEEVLAYLKESAKGAA